MNTKETKRLYYDDSYQVAFDARVLEKVFFEDKPALILDRTCFYPESGGQPSDRGNINGIDVVDVREENGRILHLLEANVLSDHIKGEVDWKTRFDHMQQHTGQHILSQAFYALCKGETVSFHLSEKYSTLEINLFKITNQEVENVEKLANSIVFQDREIKTYFMSEEEVKDIPLRKPPKKKGLIRVVEASDFDYSACGGTHTGRTGEIGLIKIVKWEKMRGNTRFEFLCGGRALKDYTEKNRILRQLSVRFTVSEQEVLSSVEKLSSDFKAQKKKNKKITDSLTQYEAGEIIKNARGNMILNIFPDKTPEEIRYLASSIVRKGEYIVLLGTKKGDKVHLILACSENLDLDMRELVPVISPLIKGRGGGRPSFIEIAGEDTGNLEKALETAKSTISKWTV